MSLDQDGLRNLAAALLENTLKVLAQEEPVDPGPDAKRSTRASYRRRLRLWYHGRVRDVAWIRDASRSARFIEAAGLDYDAFVSKVKARKLLSIPEIPDELREDDA